MLPPTKSPKKSSAASIPLRRVFTSCHIITSRCTCLVCLFVRSFVPLVGCCIVSLPLVVALHPVPSCRHATSLRYISSLVVHLIIVESSRCRVSSCLVIVSRPLTHLVMPALFDCCVYCHHRAAAATAVPCRAVLLPPLPLPPCF